MSASDEIPDYHGWHVQPPRPDHAQVAWYTPTRRVPRIRVSVHTCGCQAVVYELCAAGGQGFVRRTDRAEKTVHETAWMAAAAARRVFELILSGRIA
ncbi:hypothetical protein AB0C27_35050 [Nonomuraea sp. NPDC048882]|uniref:hypothetical protein n=1 Tax=Nonomuraea sp. NPDC048882 TaxID=3154347 RepID=UPI003409A677